MPRGVDEEGRRLLRHVVERAHAVLGVDRAVHRHDSIVGKACRTDELVLDRVAAIEAPPGAAVLGDVDHGAHSHSASNLVERVDRHLEVAIRPLRVVAQRRPGGGVHDDVDRGVSHRRSKGYR